MATLISRVKSHCRGQATSGQNTLALTLECVDHMFGESGDWTPLAHLIGGSEAGQSRMVRAVVGKVVQGWTFKADEKQDSGIRFVKKVDANQGIDSEFRTKLVKLVEARKSIQSEAVKSIFTPKLVKVFDPEAYAKTVLRKLQNEGFSLEEFEALLEAAKAA